MNVQNSLKNVLKRASSANLASNVSLAKSCENAVFSKGDNLPVGIIPSPY